MSPEQYKLHNFDVLLRGLEISSYVYRYFFYPPTPEDKAFLEEIISLTKSKSFNVPVAQVHILDDFQSAIEQTLNSPEKGKHLFVF